MKKIDTTYWKSFLVSELFITDNNGKQVPTGANIPKLELKENGKTPRITVTAINNGVFGYFDYIGEKPSNYRLYSNFISVSFLGTVFYQAEETSLDMKVHCLKPINHELNKYTGEFLVAAIKASLINYKYSDQLSSSVLPKLEVSLPSKDELPDWQYMEDYMCRIEQRTKAAISALVSSQYSPSKIDTSYWKEYPLYSDFLFEVNMGSKLDRVKMTKFNPIVNFVGRGSINNGVVDNVDLIEGINPYNAGCITLSLGGSVGASFIQEKPFYTSQNVCVLIPKNNMSIYCKRFIVTMIQNEGQRKYKAFSDELNRHIRTDFRIKLPATPSGEPDWRYMEMYMRGVEAIVKSKLAILAPRKPEVTIKDAETVTFTNANVTYIDKSTNYNIKK